MRTAKGIVVASIRLVLGCCNSSIGVVCSDAHVGYMLRILESSNQYMQGMWWVYVQLWVDEVSARILFESKQSLHNKAYGRHKLS